MPDLNDTQRDQMDNTITPKPDTQPDQQTPDPQQTSQPSPVPQQPTQPQTPPQPQQPATVTNAAPANSQQPSDATDPAIQHASRFYRFASALAGGPRTRTVIDPATGVATRQTIPLSRGDIGMAIALEALSGGITGLAQSGPGATGRAAAAGFQTVMQQQQQARQAQEQQAQQDYQNEYQSLTRRAQAFEVNSRTILNTAQAERYGLESLKDNVNQNEKLLADYDDAGAVLQRNVAQDSLRDGMANGAYSATDQIAVPDGYTNLGGRWEQTFSIIQNPSAKIPLTNAQAQALGNSYVLGFLPYRDGKTKLPEGFNVTGTVLANANSQAVANRLMLRDANGVTDTLAKSDDPATQDLAKEVPNFKDLLSDPERGAGLQAALGRFQKYVSHSDQHGMDLYESLQQMAAPSKPDPTNPKVMVPNRDAPFAQTVAGAFGNGDPARGWQILQRYHEEIEPEQITSEAQAADMIASSEPGSRAYRYAQRWIASNTQQKTAIVAVEARARQDAKPQVSAGSLATPDALGFVPTVSDAKEANKRFGTFKKNLDSLSQSEQSYAQFQNSLADINAGKWTGADSVVALFNAIGLSATPLAGRGFRVNQNVIAEHEHARGWEGALQAKLQGVQTGAVITPQQLRDYAGIASQTRANQIIATANEMHSAGISADAALPSGNGQRISPDTAAVFLRLAGNDPAKARQAAAAKGWSF